MPARAPSVCPCGQVVAAGVLCACRARRRREVKATADARRPNASARGYGTKWQSARIDFLKANPVCVRCPEPSTVVDHKQPHRGDLKLFWRRSNWQALCTHCHASAKQREEAADAPRH